MSLIMQFRWSLRDLRARWVQIASIALVIGLGTGAFASLNSLATWRYAANDASYELTRMYDLRVRLLDGSFLPAGSLKELLGRLEVASAIQEMDERLIVPTQVDVDAGGQSLLVPGRLVGMDLSDDGPHVSLVHVGAGRNLSADDRGEDVVVLEQKFADEHGLPDDGELQLAGGARVRYVGTGLAPEHFVVVTETGGVYAHANYAVVFTSLETAGQLSGLGGLINDIVLTLQPGESREQVGQEIESAFAELLPSIGMTVMTPVDDPAYRMVTQDVDGDQQIANIVAATIFSGAVFAAFNLTARMVEAQRREIGIAMALGVPPVRIAIRPLLVGLEIALLGVGFGIGVGYALGEAMRYVMVEFMPLPVFETPFQLGVFGIVAAGGLAIPMLAIGYPVWRAVRVQPVTAIRTGHLAARGGGLAPLLGRLPSVGDSFWRMPFRNVARAPRRTILTVLGVAAAISVLVAILGLLDSFLETVDRGRDEILGENPDRIAVNMFTVYPVDSPQFAAISAAESVTSVEPALRVEGGLSSNDDSFDVVLQFIDFDSGLWRPTITLGAAEASQPGVLISEKAADDLGVRPGDTITVRHPRRLGAYSFTFVETTMPVLGTHPLPFRSYAYMDFRHAGLMALENTANVAYVLPSAGSDLDDVKRYMFGLEGVASVESVASLADVFEQLIGQFFGLLRVVEFIPLLIALLIAFNNASIGMDERAREHATMFAFGVPVPKVLRMAVVESLIIGVLGTLLGLAGGALLLLWMLRVNVAQNMPDIGVVMALTPLTILLVLALGVMAVAVAPLLTIRRLQRMNIPSALRVME